MKLAIRLALLGLAIAPVVALADNSPTVVLATPGIGDGAIERFPMRFSTPMVPLGDPRAAAPFAGECAVAGEGRWVDPQTYVYDFKNGLPGGTQCSFKLRDGLKSVAGYAYSGQQEFKVDAGGPVARAVLAGNSSDDGIEEDQVFLVAVTLPAGHDMALMWGKGISGAGGKTAGADQRFDYTVRKPFTARFECSRVNAQAGCSPVEKAWVRFSAPIPAEQARAITIQLPDGKVIKPDLFDGGNDNEHGDARTKAVLSSVGFSGPLPESTTAKLLLPADVKDESGREQFNASRFPLKDHYAQAPPLIKFAAQFGILEASEGGVLPVTVRNVEPALQGIRRDLAGQTLRVGDSDAQVAEWLHTVGHSDDADSHEEAHGKEKITINDPGSRPILAAGQGSGMTVGLPGKGKDFEVVGVPLGKPGFYVVEFASPVLGQALLGRKAPRYVASAALVTNMAVHFKRGREKSLAWVTRLA